MHATKHEKYKELKKRADGLRQAIEFAPTAAGPHLQAIITALIAKYNLSREDTKDAMWPAVVVGVAAF